MRTAEALRTSTVRLPSGALSLAATVLAATAGAAGADVAAITADLTHPASGVPQPVVALAPPSGEALPMGPGSNLSVRMTLPVGQPLTGILVPPGTNPVWTTSLSKKVFWDLAVMEAIKHALARGTQIDSLTFTHYEAAHPDSADPDLLIDIEPYDAPPQAPLAMSLDEVERSVEASLPEWAALATTDVIDDAVGERVVSVALRLPSSAFRVLSGSQILQPLVASQQELAPQGANIGRVTVAITDSATGQPLYAGGADSMFGFVTEWYSPLVQAIIPTDGIDSEDVRDDVERIAEDPAAAGEALAP
jgi:hypothetical protein